MHGDLEGRTEALVVEGEMDEALQHANHQDDQGIEDGLVEDGLDQRRAAKAVDHPDVVGDQHGLADDQRGGGRQRKPDSLNQ